MIAHLSLLRQFNKELRRDTGLIYEELRDDSSCVIVKAVKSKSLGETVE
jgi:hypothetical protein